MVQGVQGGLEDLEDQGNRIQIRCLNLPSLLWRRSALVDLVDLETQSLPSVLKDQADQGVPQDQAVQDRLSVPLGHQCTGVSHQVLR